MSGNHEHWTLFRDLLVFQLKLIIDGIRDLILLPVSVIAALAGIISHPSSPGRYFQRVLRWGKHSEKWIGLFTAVEASELRLPKESENLDVVINRLESQLRTNAEQDGLTKKARDSIDKSISQIRSLARRRAEQSGRNDSSGDDE